MVSIPTIIFYVLIFMSVYVQVFLLVTFLENRKKIIIRNGAIKLSKYPAVTIIVPCWNEEKTVYKTIRSLFDLNYPKDKVKIFLVDDGSTDGTWNIISKFAKYKNVTIFRKENGGKHSALNLGLEHVETEFLACLDADSYTDRESLVRLMSYFEKDPSAMAVAPSIVASNAHKIIQKAQKAEYHLGVYMKKMLGFLGAINVTPGPLTVFKITHCNDAYVYTNTPGTIKKLYRQRLRWIYGFINNTIDYRGVLLQKKYGNFALFTLPTGIISIFAVGYMFGRIIYNVGSFIYDKVIHFQAVGFQLGREVNAFDPFFINTKMSLFLVTLVYFIVFFAMMSGAKMYDGKWKFSFGMFYFFPVFMIIAPFWILKAIWNTLLSRAPAWR
ncbi:glycosyltransferase [Candidatus Nomurabacteria bacterium]|nr:glycosyltransferase [Candidatus Nomurabacteria bacterium]